MDNKAIAYKEPTILSRDDAFKYYDKIKIFKHFTTSITVIYFEDPIITIEYDLNKYKHMNKKEYDEYLKTEQYKQERSFECFYIGNKGPLSKYDGYMSEFKETNDNLDELDRKFLETKISDKKIELYGLHTYGGYYVFFRPDFYEVIGLLSDELSLDELESVERIYITTEPHPNDDIAHCFDARKHKHRGKTTCHIFYNDKRATKRLKTTD
jgi:hypothetical protein